MDYREEHVIDVHVEFIPFDNTLPILKNLDADVKKAECLIMEEIRVHNHGISLRNMLIIDLKNADMVCAGGSRKLRRIWRT